MRLNFIREGDSLSQLAADSSLGEGNSLSRLTADSSLGDGNSLSQLAADSSLGEGALCPPRRGGWHFPKGNVGWSHIRIGWSPFKIKSKPKQSRIRVRAESNSAVQNPLYPPILHVSPLVFAVSKSIFIFSSASGGIPASA